MPDPPLTARERATLRARLVAERALVAERLVALTRAFDQLVDAADLEPPDDEHDPDGTTAYERAQVSSLAREAEHTLADLDRAVAEIDDPAFGACATCGSPIGLARLEAVPGTRTCIECAAGRA